ncbi:LigB subunit of an aromatic-ring-opening dioxygenase LigAB [Hortaea werneckii]|nr:LigB subunit of an aromatic-ring-opening dioxygenase LigAB [Hortaea werneckii]KAI7303141.1 LigB subunit of an aromatic-ring-opening dioxygenase LigAB [Hortaea werneckii]
MAPTPVFFYSHGSTMMLGEESESADYWKKCGDEALEHGIKGVIMMGAHWDARGENNIEVSMNPCPGKSPVAYVHPSKYVDYKLEPDLPTGNRVISMLNNAGINTRANETFEWIHDTYLILIRMFPNKCPPTTIISMNTRFDPHLHMKVGNKIRPLRHEGYLVIGTGGAVHNLYRNVWAPMLRYRDNFAQETPPEGWALEFRQSVEDCITQNRGPALRRAITRLMKHPQYRDAHATDDHFMAACFVAGAAGDWEDEEQEKGRLGAETWELTNMPFSPRPNDTTREQATTIGPAAVNSTTIQPQVYRHIAQGSGGTYTFTDNNVQHIGTSGCLTCVGIYFVIDDHRCFAAHVNADTVTKSGGWSRKINGNTRDKIKAEVKQRLDNEQTKSEWGPVSQTMRESLIMVCSRCEETLPLVGDAVAAAVQEWLGMEERIVPRRKESFIVRHPNENLCLFDEQPSNRRWFRLDEAANSDWGILAWDD